MSVMRALIAVLFLASIVVCHDFDNWMNKHVLSWKGHHGLGDKEKKHHEHLDMSEYHSEINGHHYEKSYGPRAHSYNHHYGVNLVGLGKDDHEDIYRPCALQDWHCIRHFISKNSKCTPAYGPVSDPLTQKRYIMHMPNANLTLVQENFQVRGMGTAKINDFYVNKYTGNLVISIQTKTFDTTSPRVYYRYQRRARESIVLAGSTTTECDSMLFTAVIPKIPHLRLDLAEVHMFAEDNNPRLDIDPKAFKSTDPQVKASFAALLANLVTASVGEAFVYLSQLLVANYIQENICDFGLDLGV